MCRNLRVTDTGSGELCECRRECGEQLGLQLAFNFADRIYVCEVSADIGIEADRIGNLEAVFTEALYCDVDIKTDVAVNDTEGDRRRGAVLDARELLDVEVVDTLVFCRLAAECEPLADLREDVLYTIAEASGPDGRFGLGVITEFARLCADVDNLTLFDDDHALSVRNCDYRTIGNDVVIAVVGAKAPDLFSSLDGDNVSWNSITVEILFPLIGEGAACCR